MSVLRVGNLVNFIFERFSLDISMKIYSKLSFKKMQIFSGESFNMSVGRRFICRLRRSFESLQSAVFVFD